MKIGFDLKESAYEGTIHFGKLILEAGEDTVSINISTRKNDKGELFICLPSRKSEKGEYINQVFISEDLYEKINKKLNKEFNK